MRSKVVLDYAAAALIHLRQRKLSAWGTLFFSHKVQPRCFGLVLRWTWAGGNSNCQLDKDGG